MRFIQGLSNETTKLLQKVYQVSKYHQVRQCAQCLSLSYQGYTTNELAHIFQVDRITIYNWFNAWDTRHFAGLYDKKGRRRHDIFDSDQKEQIRQWSKMHPKNLNKILALVYEHFGIESSKQTIKRVLKSFQFSWCRICKIVKSESGSKVYQERKQALESLLVINIKLILYRHLYTG